MAPTLEAMRNALHEVANHPDLGRAVAVNGRAYMTTDEWKPIYRACQRALFRARSNAAMPPMKIKMMLHFATSLGPFAPEEQRRSEAYVTFVRELLRDDMIERPTKAQRARHAGWAYMATPRGRCYIKALEALPLPVRTDPEWAMPTSQNHLTGEYHDQK